MPRFMAIFDNGARITLPSDVTTRGRAFKYVYDHEMDKQVALDSIDEIVGCPADFYGVPCTKVDHLPNAMKVHVTTICGKEYTWTD